MVGMMVCDGFFLMGKTTVFGFCDSCIFVCKVSSPVERMSSRES